MAPRHPRQANAGSTDKGRYNMASRPLSTGQTSTINNTSAVGLASTGSLILNNPTCRPFPNLGGSATYGSKRPNSDRQDDDDEDDDDEDADDNIHEDDGEYDAAPRRHRDTIRQSMIDKDSRYFTKQRAQKARNDKKKAAAAEKEAAAVNQESAGEEIKAVPRRDRNQSASKQGKDAAAATVKGDEEETQVAPNPARRKPATKKGRGKGKEPAAIEDADTSESDDNIIVGTNQAKKAPAGDKGDSEAATSTTTANQAAQGPSIQAGNLVKKVQGSKKPEPERGHGRQEKLRYDFAPSDSEVDRKNDTLRKLRNTVDRHAFWCPFVRLNKKMENMHRRMTKLEGLPEMDSSSDGDEGGKAKTAKGRGARKTKSSAAQNKKNKERSGSKDGTEKDKVEEDGREGEEAGEAEDREEEDEEPVDDDPANHEYHDKPHEDQGRNNGADAAAEDGGKKLSKFKIAAKRQKPTTSKTSKSRAATKKSKASSAHVTEANYDMLDDVDGLVLTQGELAALKAVDRTDSRDESDASSVSQVSAGIPHGVALLDKDFKNGHKTIEQEEAAEKERNDNNSRRKSSKAAWQTGTDWSFQPEESADDDEDMSLTGQAFEESMVAHGKTAKKAQKRKATAEEPGAGSKPADKKRRTSRQSGLTQS